MALIKGIALLLVLNSAGVEFTLSHAMYFTLLLTVVIYGLRCFKKLKVYGRILTIFTGVIFILEVLNFLLAKLYENNMPTFHVVSFVQIIGYTIVYSLLLENRFNIRFIQVLGGLFLILSLLQFSQINLWGNYPSMKIILCSSLVLIASLLLFYELLISPEKDVQILKEFKFWFNAGNIIFFGLLFFIFGFMEYLNNLELDTNLIWVYRLIEACNFVLYGSYLYALINESRKNSVA